ncbi:hypothetical protein TanjilG_05444 [Lupinus angustifolius]|uniref:Uncharacterized protein n=1 Tax=Lupinus angustifolius TaxID=3871 RepID=A0A4P1QSQ4_LUPAN|nr:hypothetical protein TanjilG_05444 [Lupinus angustifolius]
MGIHMVVVAIAKLHWQLSSHNLRPTVVGFAYPMVLKLLMSSFRLFQDEALYQSRLFFFTISQIVHNRDLPLSTRSRLERAITLILRFIATTSIGTTSEGLEIGHDTFYALSMIAL